jgi:hypothetical protein
MGAALPDEGRKAARREKPLNGTNPGYGSRMEQACKPRCGVNRREVAKTCGRNIVGPWKSRARVDALGDVVKRDGTLVRQCSFPKGNERATM